MDAKATSEKILEMICPHTFGREAPVAYISIEMGGESPFSEEELNVEFDILKWDTTLASAELFITHKPGRPNQAPYVCIEGISFFSEDGKDPDPTSDDSGFLFLNEIIPLSC